MSKNKINPFLLLLAKLGFFKYDGCECMQPRWPRAQVLYPDGLYSRPWY